MAISWVLLISIDDLRQRIWYEGRGRWYRVIGYAVVNNGVFAVVQAALYYKVWLGAKGAIMPRSEPESETEALLGSVGGSVGGPGLE